MCGIAGIVNSNPEVLGKMLQAQAHRGPDYTGIWEYEEMLLGHNRLSIIDKSEAAHQPMASANGRYIIVFNGEIYNYRELKTQYLSQYQCKSKGDSEILLELMAAYGVSILDELIGMFAFALYDKEEKKLTLVRDRFGVKPLFYNTQNRSFYFSSELGAMWAAGIERTPRIDVWAGYFSHGTYGLPEETFWEGIYNLPAGHYLTVDCKDLSVALTRWYHFEKSVARITHAGLAESISEQYISLLEDAVKLRFRSDVPVGFTLSGGLDSSLLLASVQDIYPNDANIRAYTFYCNHPDYDELSYARKLIEPTHKVHIPVLMEHQEVPDLAAEMSIIQGEPFGAIPTLAYSKLFKVARAQGHYVLLDGQGIDEAWAGYDYYSSNNDFLVQGSVASPVVPDALMPDFASNSPDTNYLKPFDNRLQNLQYRDLFYTKIPRALRFNDRASMIWSVELREPFLDHRLVEFAFNLPESYKIKDGQSKWFLRKMASKLLGDQLSFAPKRALQTPQREWLRSELKDWAYENISWLWGPGNPGWFHKPAMMKSWEAYQTQPIDNSFYIWQWINSSLLLRENKGN